MYNSTESKESMSQKYDTMFLDHARHIEEIRTQGYTIIRNAIPEELRLRLLETIKRFNEEEIGIKRDRNIFGQERKNIKTKMLLNRGQVFEQAFAYDPLLAVCEEILGKGFLLWAAPTVCVAPGEEKQHLHTDDLYLGLPRPYQALELTTIWALEDFTEENGATHIVPGSHLWPEPPRATLSELAVNPRDAETICAEMPRGSILVLNGAAWHGAGANRSDKMRYGLAVTYCRGWLRQQENFQLGIPPEKLRSFSPRLQELCGLGVYEEIFGSINEMAPKDVLWHPEKERLMGLTEN